MKDSEIVSKLIFLSFVAEPPEPTTYGPDNQPLLTWGDAMGLYARCIEREVCGPSGTPAPTGGGLTVQVTAAPEVMDFARDIEDKCEAEDEAFAAAVAALDDPLSVLDPEPEPDKPMKPGLILDPPPIYPDSPNPLQETVALRAKDIKADLSTVPSFKGKGATEKRATFDRMNRFRETHRTQAFKVAAEASDGKLTEWQLRDMMGGKPAPMCRWNDLAAALDRLEVL